MANILLFVQIIKFYYLAADEKKQLMISDRIIILPDNSISIKAFRLSKLVFKLVILCMFLSGTVYLFLFGNGNIDLTVIAALVFVYAVLYMYYFRDLLIDINKTITYNDASITIDKKLYDKQRVCGVFVTIGSIGVNAITLSYRVGIRFRTGSFFSKRKSLITFSLKEEAIGAAQLLAKHLGCEFLDETDR